MNKDQFELLAPGGDIDSIKAAIAAGADAVYCGLDKFNARNRATNLDLDTLNGLVDLAHQHNCKIFLTLNIIILESEVPTVVRLLNKLVNTHIDGVIIQDLGLGYILKHYFPSLDMHASTQLNTHNEGQILLLNKLGASRVNLSRELNISEIKHLAQFGLEHDVLMEVFVHGSYCIGFSGLCYISSVKNGASGNRGRCSQPCRDQYETTKVGKNYPLNMKDNSAYGDLNELVDAGVYSLKVEGRIKKAHYVYTVVDNWRKQIDTYCAGGQPLTDTKGLYTVFNRDFSNSYLKDNISQDMYIDNPRDNSSTHFTKIYGCTTEASIDKVKKDLFDEKTDIMALVEEKTKDLVIDDSKSLTVVKGDPDYVKAVELPKLPPSTPLTSAPKLSVLISSAEDVALCEMNTSTTPLDVFYQLPMALSTQLAKLSTLFTENPALIPWFSAIQIGDDFEAARTFLDTVKPALIVTNNTGVAQLAYERGIQWVAGPQLNITNSYALKCIQQEYKGSGAFISNELSKLQMRKIVRPDNFRLFHSIYHPITMLTSRQCLFLQSVGCKKKRVDNRCLKGCEKTTSIINLKDKPYVIDKKKGDHNSLYSEQNFLNTDVLRDCAGLYSDVLIDLRNIKTQTKVSLDKAEIDNAALVVLFQEMLQESMNHLDTRGDKVESPALVAIKQALAQTSSQQYKKGL